MKIKSKSIVSLLLGFTLFIIAPVRLSAETTRIEDINQSLIETWIDERDVAVFDYLSLWLQGADSTELMRLGMTIIGKELNIVSLSRTDATKLRENTILCGRDFDLQSLPYVLLEINGVTLDVQGLFEGRSFFINQEQRISLIPEEGPE